MLELYLTYKDIIVEILYSTINSSRLNKIQVLKGFSLLFAFLIFKHISF